MHDIKKIPLNNFQYNAYYIVFTGDKYQVWNKFHILKSFFTFTEAKEYMSKLVKNSEIPVMA